MMVICLSLQWDRYMKCDGSPDPTVQGEINTFMNLWREDLTEKDINTILKGAQLTLGVSMSCGKYIYR